LAPEAISSASPVSPHRALPKSPDLEISRSPDTSFTANKSLENKAR